MDFDKLDDDQIEVVRWKPEDGDLRVVSAAGSGKTTTVTALTTKLVLVDDIAPEDICVLTFANKAGLETYLPHAAHQEFVGKLKPLLDKVCVLDYEAR